MISPLDVSTVLNYLNDKCSRKLRHTGRNRSYIQARMAEGYSIRDLQLIILHRSELWGDDPDMKQYLRPMTLFNPSHFEDYLVQAQRWSKEKIAAQRKRRTPDQIRKEGG